MCVRVVAQLLTYTSKAKINIFRNIFFTTCRLLWGRSIGKIQKLLILAIEAVFLARVSTKVGFYEFDFDIKNFALQCTYFCHFLIIFIDYRFLKISDSEIGNSKMSQF